MGTLLLFYGEVRWKYLRAFGCAPGTNSNLLRSRIARALLSSHLRTSMDADEVSFISHSYKSWFLVLYFAHQLMLNYRKGGRKERRSEGERKWGRRKEEGRRKGERGKQQACFLGQYN